MSQGIFGLFDFSGGVESPHDLENKVAAFLQIDGV